MSENTMLPPNSGKKARLGRGLGSLLGSSVDLDEDPVVAEASERVATTPAPSARAAQAAPINEEAQIWNIPVENLEPNTQQPRQVFSPEALGELTASIKEKGILQPIVARRLGERRFEIIAGERRWRAAQSAGLREVPVILKKVSERDSLELAIIENIQRENLNAIEEAEAYEHLLNDYSLTQQQVAERLGKERSSVANALRLLSLPAEVKMMVSSGELSAGHAKVILALEDKRDQIEVAQEVIKSRLSVRATEKLVAKAREEKSVEDAKTAMDFDVPRRLIDGLSSELQKLIGTKVTIDYASAKGKLSIHFYSDEQLTQLVEKLRRAWEK